MYRSWWRYVRISAASKQKPNVTFNEWMLRVAQVLTGISRHVSGSAQPDTPPQVEKLGSSMDESMYFLLNMFDFPVSHLSF